MPLTVFVGSFKPPHAGHLSIVKAMLKATRQSNGYIYVFISNKPREPCSKLDGKMSKWVWTTFLQTLPEKDRKRVRLILSNLSSPTQTAYGFVRKATKPGEKIFMVQSSKEANKRYVSMRTIPKRVFHEVIIPEIKGLSSTEMRLALHDQDHKAFNRFLPAKLDEKTRKELWKKLTPLCVK